MILIAAVSGLLWWLHVSPLYAFLIGMSVIVLVNQFSKDYPDADPRAQALVPVRGEH